MSMALIIEFFTSLPKLVSAVQALVEETKALKQDSINKALQSYKDGVNNDLNAILKAKTDEERKKLSLDLALKLNK